MQSQLNIKRMQLIDNLTKEVNLGKMNHREAIRKAYDNGFKLGEQEGKAQIFKAAAKSDTILT